MATIANDTYNSMAAHAKSEANGNLLFGVYSDKIHSSDVWLTRLWNAFRVLSNGRN
jgi:hypothetical protein